MAKKTRLVLRVRNSEFLLRLYPDRMETCNHIKDAMDVSELDTSVLNKMLNALTTQGFQPKVMEVKNV